jgi:hypothetical protein
MCAKIKMEALQNSRLHLATGRITTNASVHCLVPVAGWDPTCALRMSPNGIHLRGRKDDGEGRMRMEHIRRFRVEFDQRLR